MATNYLHGHNVLLYSLDAEPSAAADLTNGVIACAKSANLSTSTGTEEITKFGDSMTNTSTAMRELAATQFTWSITSDTLAITSDAANDTQDIFTDIKAGAYVWAVFGEIETNKYYVGKALVTSLDINTESGAVATASVTLEGSGELNYVTLA